MKSKRRELMDGIANNMCDCGNHYLEYNDGFAPEEWDKIDREMAYLDMRILFNGDDAETISELEELLKRSQVLVDSL